MDSEFTVRWPFSMLIRNIDKVLMVVQEVSHRTKCSGKDNDNKGTIDNSEVASSF